MNWKDKIIDLAGDLGEEGLEELLKMLDEIEAKADEPYKKVILAMVADLLVKHGLEGIEIAEDLLKRMGEKKRVNLNDLSVRTASEVVAKLQNAEADDRKLQQKYLHVVADVLTEILTALVFMAENPNAEETA